MATHMAITEKDIARKIKQGRGSGEGAHFEPWLKKHEIGSIGQSREVLGIKTLRGHHFLSKIEYRSFLILEQDPAVLDIREQFPLLDRVLVCRIADKLGIRVPVYVGTDVVYVMTTDFLTTVQSPEGRRLKAYAVKPSSALEDRRTCDLLKIEEHYWAANDVEWSLITEAEISDCLWRNIRWLRSGVLIGPDIRNGELDSLFLNAMGSVNWEGVPLKHVLRGVAAYMGVPQARVENLFKHHAWHGNIEIDLTRGVIGLLKPLPSLMVPRLSMAA